MKKTKRFDIIVSNPPYIPTQDIESLDTEVKNYDPKIALDGGIDGLDFYKKLIQTSPQYLAVNGMLMLEIGFGQSKSITKLLE